MKRLIIVLILMVLVMGTMTAPANAAPAQPQANAPEITGQVQDEQGAPLEFATVAVFNADSLVVAAATTDSLGRFTLTGLKEDTSRRVQVSLLGYKSYEETLKISQYLGTFILVEDSEALDAARISTKKQLVVQKLDKLIFNVSEAVTAQGTTADEMLKKAPGISIDKDDNIQLNGKTVAVWIDGRPSNLSGSDLMAILKATDSGTIESIEIMAHPSSKYDAAGSGGIIDIKMKKNVLDGLNGSVALRHQGWVANKEYIHSSGGSLNLNYRSKISNTSFTYTPSFSKDLYETNNLSKFFDENGNQIQASESHTYERSTPQRHNLRMVNDFYITEKDVLGVILSGSVSKGNEATSPAESWTRTKTPLGTTFQQNTIINTSRNPNIQGDLNYTHTFDKNKASELTLDAFYGYYKNDKMNKMYSPYIDTVSREPFPGATDFYSDSRQDIHIWSAKADFQHLFAYRYMFEAGAKVSSSRTYNNVDRKDMNYDLPVPQYETNPFFSSEFLYREYVAALYANLATSFAKGKVSMKVGLRGEYTNSVGDWRSQDTTTRRSFFDLFPTVYVGYNPTMEHRLGLSYTRRIQRPSFWNMNPQFVYYDAVGGTVGDPQIRPAYTNDVSLSYGFRTWLNIAMIYSHTKDCVSQKPIQDLEHGRNGFQWTNAGTQDFAGVNISVSEGKIAPWFYVNANIFTAYVGTGDKSYKTNSFMLQAYGNLTFVLPKDWKIEAGVYGGKGFKIQQLAIAPTLNVWAGVKKDFLDGRATATLFFDDLTGSHFNVASKTPLNQYTLDQNWYGRRVNLSFTYRFGKAQQSKYRRVGQHDESSRVSGGGGSGFGASTGAPAGR